MNDTIDWRAISARLRAPFAPEEVDFRVQGRVNEQTGKGQVVAYIDARSVQDRLDDVVGAGSWSFAWEPVVIDKGDVQVAKGTLMIHGVAKADVGTASNFEASLGAVSHCFKRAAVHWGIGRYLYDLSAIWVPVEKGGRISEDLLRSLRAKLPRPGNEQPTAPQQNAPVRSPEGAGAVVTPEKRRMATPEQWNTLRTLCARTRAEEPEPGTLSFERAGALIAEYSETYKRLVAQQQRQNVGANGANGANGAAGASR